MKPTVGFTVVQTRPDLFVFRLTRFADPAAHPPRPLYLRAPDAAPPTRLPGQPRQTAP